LHILQVRSGSSDNDPHKPCILLYAREHADEQDGSWLVQGALQLLISSNPEAVQLRREFSFLIIPLLDPDGASVGEHENIITSFTLARETPESLAYTKWFKAWIDQGNRLDLALNIHNPPPTSAFHVACPQMDSEQHRLDQSLKLHATIRNELTSAGYSVRETPWTRGITEARLGAWLAKYYGTILLPYEVNSVSPKRQLNLTELRDVGKVMVSAAADYVRANPDFLHEVDRVRLNRDENWKFIGNKVSSDDPIVSEEQVQSLARGTTKPSTTAIH
jgi:hypothetical protein